jgi:hypothetical protein
LRAKRSENVSAETEIHESAPDSWPADIWSPDGWSNGKVERSAVAARALGRVQVDVPPARQRVHGVVVVVVDGIEDAAEADLMKPFQPKFTGEILVKIALSR